MKKSILIFLGVFALTFNAKAQDGFEGYLLADNNDRGKLIDAYIDPAMKGLIYGMNNGWYHTAKVHKPFGFDISIGLNASIVPEADEMFTLSGLTSVNTGSITAASVAGSEDNTPLTTVNFVENGTTYSTTFNAPGGVKESLPLNAVPAPAVQLSLGLPAKFEVSLRLVPKVGSDDVKGNLFGLGLKKEITSWFGPMDKTPLHVSLLAAYTTMTVDYNINSSGDVSVQDGLAEFKLNAYTVQAVASLNFPIINIYGGIGYGSGNSTLKMLGDYTLSYGALSRTISDPINSEFNAGGFRTTIGTRLSLGFLKIFGSYTLQEYNTANLGVAISIR
ncbi:hypothetical protein H9W90_08985 [Polaribacter pectinis]|uniref:Outer membrane protein beta-barrel domain-containing protein n=1 Tax=Polaribacter pectinis TaxID=2738844 RepID=A0A7G9L6U3_9FLAO|nr:DUF6588 family protein [Polaribacter pectinis]QNM84342.1 hypothetical protein H9W90_08985 [Polaribacter pectinis]